MCKFLKSFMTRRMKENSRDKVPKRRNIIKTIYTIQLYLKPLSGNSLIFLFTTMQRLEKGACYCFGTMQFPLLPLICDNNSWARNSSRNNPINRGTYMNWVAQHLSWLWVVGCHRFLFLSFFSPVRPTGVVIYCHLCYSLTSRVSGENCSAPVAHYLCLITVQSAIYHA